MLSDRLDLMRDIRVSDQIVDRSIKKISHPHQCLEIGGCDPLLIFIDRLLADMQDVGQLLLAEVLSGSVATVGSS